MMSEQQSSRRCVRCKYDLTGLDDRAVCPECGTPVVLSAIFRNSPGMVKTEARLMQRERSYLRGRIGAFSFVVLSILTIFVVTYVLSTVPSGTTDNETMTGFVMMMGGQPWFWGAVAYAAHARYQHAKSARLYRAYLLDRDAGGAAKHGGGDAAR